MLVRDPMKNSSLFRSRQAFLESWQLDVWHTGLLYTFSVIINYMFHA
uniref:Uncharacterized protein n=1 Tax=Rhizophora mucronata TaxID=61149 RepID=A0A2P2PQW9_RHIMU